MSGKMMSSAVEQSVKVEQEDEDDELFYFESDHLALKGNEDYSELLKTIFTLEAQRAQAVIDYDLVVDIKNEALEDPFSFVEKIRRGESIGVPDLQTVVEIPVINFSKYNVLLPEDSLDFLNTEGSTEKQVEPVPDLSSKGPGKNVTYKKPWTVEEQRQLEELLLVYPPEPVELHRIKKIATHLENRTFTQVLSRVQKYFLKLYKAGLPVPGRIPKHAEKSKKSKMHLHQRHNHYLFKPTTFFPELNIPVTMNDKEEVPGPSTQFSASTSSSSLSYLMPTLPDDTEINNSINEEKGEIDMKLEILEKVKLEKQNEDWSQGTHDGFKCDYCDEDPIQGTRWHCETCTLDSVDFCSDCVISQMYSSSPHPSLHRLHPVRVGAEGLQELSWGNDSSSESALESIFQREGGASSGDEGISDDSDGSGGFRGIKEEKMEPEDQQ